MADNIVEGEPRQCADRVKKENKTRDNLFTEPIEGGNTCTFFTDGCNHRSEKGELISVYAVMEEKFEEQKNNLVCEAEIL